MIDQGKKLLSMNDIDITNKKIIIRADLNVPMQGKHILNDARIRAILPTLHAALSQNAAIILLSHLGRPKPGSFNTNFSLEPIAFSLTTLLNKTVRFEKNWLQGFSISPGEIVLCENVRFNPGEKENDAHLAKQMSKLGDIFIMDAFATAHRDEASTTGISHYIPAVAGPLLIKELDELNKILINPSKPLVAIIGGSKVSTKIDLLNSLLQKVDVLMVGGGIANTFLAANKQPIGNSLYEPDKVEFVQILLEQAKRTDKIILMPVDAIVTQTQVTGQKSPMMIQRKQPQDIEKSDIIYDIGPDTIKLYAKAIQNASTILWNGPMGLFEQPEFESGTKHIASFIAQSNAYSIAGGGETIAAIEKYHLTNQISYLSTGGGAFLTVLEGKTLPAVLALTQSNLR